MTFTIKELIAAKTRKKSLGVRSELNLGNEAYAASDQSIMLFHELILNEGAKGIVELMVAYLKDIADDVDNHEDFQHDSAVLNSIASKLKT